MIEATVKDGRTKKDDGSFWQNTYINRALGEDANATTTSSSTRKRNIHIDDGKAFLGVGRKKVAKKKVAKKKVAKKKR